MLLHDESPSSFLLLPRPSEAYSSRELRTLLLLYVGYIIRAGPIEGAPWRQPHELSTPETDITKYYVLYFCCCCCGESSLTRVRQSTTPDAQNNIHSRPFLRTNKVTYNRLYCSRYSPPPPRHVPRINITILYSSTSIVTFSFSPSAVFSCLPSLSPNLQL